MAVLRVFPLGDSVSSNNLFNVRFQLKLGDIYSLQSSQIAQYEQIMTHLTTLDMLMTGEKLFRFNKRMNKLFLDIDWDMISIGDNILVECWRALNPEEYSGIYNDRALKAYSVARCKKTWGSNLKLYSGVALPGSITVNGQQIYDEAVQELKDAADMLRDTYESPVMMQLG
jgi:hypothetical protein